MHRVLSAVVHLGLASARRAASAGAIVLLAAFSMTATPSSAATGGPDAAGYRWADDLSGCDNVVPPFGGGAITTNAATTLLGPYDLGFAFAFFGEPYTQVWVSPEGYVTFTGVTPSTGLNQALPDPTDPDNLIAVNWQDVESANVTVEARPGLFAVRWVQRVSFTYQFETSYLFLGADGTFRMRWSNSRGFTSTVGYENPGGTLGSTMYRDTNGDQIPEVRAPLFPNPWGGRSACFTPPVLLACDSAIPVACGDTTAARLPPTLPLNAIAYSCSASSYRGNEQTFQVDVASLQRVTVSIDNAGLDLMQIGTPCAEGNCLAMADSQLTFPVMYPGRYHFAVDKMAAGGGDAFNFSVQCEDPYGRIACGERLAGSTIGGVGLFDTYSCTGAVLTGPEELWRLSLPTQQNLVFTLESAPPNAWVVLYELSEFESQGACIAAGRGGAGAFDVPAGEYVVVVDTEAGVGTTYTLVGTCGPQLDCTGATAAACTQVVSGNTSTTPNRVTIYNCSAEALVGGEHVYRFYNPIEQTIEARFLSSTPGQKLLLLPTCGEGDCFLSGANGVSCALFPPGQYYLVVDGTSSGPYSFEIGCSEVFRGVDLRISDIDASPLAGACGSFDVSGTTRVGVANLGDRDAAPPVRVVVFEDRDLDRDLSGGDNVLGTADVSVPIPAGQTIFLDVPSSGTVLFRDNVIFAKVDVDGTVPEQDEGNNLFDTGQGCTYRPTVGPFNPTIEWEWNTTTVLPNSTEVDTLPLVADVTGDGTPDVVFVTGEAQFRTDGVVRAVDGRTGREHWTSQASNARVWSSANLALGDLDGNTIPEIVGESGSTWGVLVILDGRTGDLVNQTMPLLDHPGRGNGGGAPAIADLDCDGLPEIIYGANAFNADGSYFWTPQAGGTRGINGAGEGGSISVVADVNGDDQLDVVAGPTAYTLDRATRTGRILWNNPAVPDGYPAIGNFDDDPAPEVAITANGNVYLLDGDTGALRWTRTIPRGGGGCAVTAVDGGPPTIADFDGDCAAEIGVAGADLYSVLEADGSVRWSAPVNDCSSRRTASSVFDFEGDGQAEVVYQDETWVRFLRGTDGSSIVPFPPPPGSALERTIAGASHTWTEMVIVADVDGDNNAEVIVPLNPPFNPDALRANMRGIRVIGDADDNWVNTRRIWNQHAYHIDNVLDDGSIPGARTTRGCELDSWRRHNTYRDQIGSGVYTAPDITISITSTEIDLIDCRRDVRIRARLGNGGGISVGRPFSGTFYDGDPSLGNVLFTQVFPDLQPGQFSDFEIVIPFPPVNSVDIWAVADDDGTGSGVASECREDNNSCVVTVEDEGLPIDPPVPVGNALRATAHGPVNAPIITGDFNWLLDAGAPRPANQHFHVLRGTTPTGLSQVPGTEPWPTSTYQDQTPRSTNAELPKVHFLKILAADECEQVEQEPLVP